MYYDTNKATMTNKCTSSAGRFDGHGNAPEQYRWHHPVWHVRGYSGSHWTPASSNYLLCIAPVAARGATGKQTTINKCTYKLAILMAMAMRRYVTARIAQWRRSRALLEATGRCHQTSIMSNNINRT
jgi:hypothetical protein